MSPYSSAQEHVTPDAFWVDKNQCRYMDSNGQVQNPTMQPCAEGISAVKAIAIAQQQGQKIYTINESNRDTALPKLPIGGEVGAEIRNAINAGKEVTFHEARINEHGWSGYGYSIVDPETGAGAYLIEGKGNGGWLLLIIGVIHLVLAFLMFYYFMPMFYTLPGMMAMLIQLITLAIGEIIAGVGILMNNKTLCTIGSSIFISIVAGKFSILGSTLTRSVLGGSWTTYCNSL
ncbi:hypothetical protein [Vandammella animalimorsus]|uniref:hypothetical protein n=1 Tax=Vandammella animalimorsus TaxID=2029117 RepID=UPI0011C39F5E|nr:hypothetical protein [Vandammella animalimorsus]